MHGDSSTVGVRAAVWLGTGDIRSREVQIGPTPPGWTRVRVEYAGICGTDLAIVAGKHPRARTPLIIGHEIVGTVVTEVTGGPPVGTRVAINPLISCRQCRACRDGSSHVCRELKLFGIDTSGGLADYIDVPVDRVVAVASGVPAERAAWAEPLAVAVRAVARAEMAARATVVIFGAGPIGLLVALVARYSGAGRVTVVETNPVRRQVAADLGIETAPDLPDVVAWFRSTNDDEGADVVFDTAGHKAVAAMLSGAVRETGTVVVVAVYKEAPVFDLRAVCFGEHTVVGARVYTDDDVRRAVDLLDGDPLGLDALPAVVLPLTSVRDAFASITSDRAPLKIFLRPGHDSGPAGSPDTARELCIDNVKGIP